MSPVLDNLVAAQPGGELTEDMFIGELLLYSIKELAVPLARARKAFRENGLDESVLPEGRRGEHVMQDACTQSAGVSRNGVEKEIRAEFNSRDANFLIYQMTQIIRDPKARVNEHRKALRVIYNFADSTLTFEAVDGPMADVQELADKIQSYYDANQSVLPGRGLRTKVRHYIEAAGGEKYFDGVYFLAKETRLTQNSKLRAHHGEVISGKEFAESMKGALRQIYKTEPPFHNMPVLNVEGEREFLQRKFIENCAEDLKTYRDECLELVKGKEDRKRAFRTDKRAAMVEARKAIDLRRKKFEGILGQTLEELDRDMRLADKALSKFLQEADA